MDVVKVDTALDGVDDGVVPYSVWAVPVVMNWESETNDVDGDADDVTTVVIGSALVAEAGAAVVNSFAEKAVNITLSIYNCC